MPRNQFGGFGGPNMQQLMKQAQKMQAQMTQMQEALEAKEYEASAGGGMVNCKVSGKHELLELSIKPEAVDPEDVEMLEDLIVAALQDGFNAVDKKTAEIMGPYSGMIGGGGF